MLSFEYKTNVDQALMEVYKAPHSISALVNLFQRVMQYGVDYLDIVPEMNLKELYENDYQLDVNDLKLAFKELEEFPSTASLANIVLVILMLIKVRGYSYQDFVNNLK